VTTKTPIKGLFDTIHTFDPSISKWYEEAPSNTPPAPRHGHKAIAKNGKMYVFFGKQYSCAFDDIWQYDPQTKEWAQITPISTNNPVARYDHTATLVGDMVWIMGGIDNGENPLNDIWAYNFTSNMWESYPSLSQTELNGHIAATYDGKLYFFGGFGGAYMNSSVYEFSPGSGTWNEYSTQGEYPGPFAYGSCVQYGPNTAFVFSGKVGTNISIQSCYKWDLTNHTFTQIADGPDVAHAAAALCPNGFYEKSNYEKFIVFGGLSDGTLTESTWVYTSDIEIPTGITGIQNTNIQVYPNPAQEYIKIELREEDMQLQDINYELSDITGRVISSHIISSSKEIIDVSEESEGLYFVKIYADSKLLKVQKIVKQ